MKFLSFWITVFLTAISAANAAQNAKPNIVVILGVSYPQLKASPDALSYTAGLRWAF